MKKLLYMTSALVGAGFLVGSVAPASAEVNIAADARYQIVSADVDDKNKTRLGETPGNKFRSIVANNRVRLHFNGEKDMANGTNTGFTLTITPSNDNLATNNAYGYIGGSFGRLQLGSQHPMIYQMGSTGTPGAGPFCAVDCDFTGHLVADPGPENYITGAFDPHAVGYRASRIGYLTPSFSGFQLGISYAPESKGAAGGETGNSGKETPGNVYDTHSFAFSYSTSYNDIGVSISAGYAGGSYTQPAGFSGADPSIVDDDDQTIGLGGLFNSIADGNLDNGNLDKVKVRGSGTIEKTRLTVDVDAPTGVVGITGVLGTADTVGPQTGLPAKIGQDPAVWGFGTKFTFGDTSLGGSYGIADLVDGGERTNFALGGSYKLDTFTFGLTWANQETQYAGYVVTAGTAADAPWASTSKVSYKGDGGAKFESDTLSFTVGYGLGDGANMSFVVERNDWTRTGTALNDDKSAYVPNAVTEDSRTGFGVALEVKF